MLFTPSLMCPYCGMVFEASMAYENPFGPGLVPWHTFHRMAECPGSNQRPRNPESDRRPLWSEGGVN